MADSRLIPLAEVARPHGVRGELRLKLYNRDSDLLLDLDEVVLEPTSGAPTTVAVREARRANDAILVWLGGCDSRDRAEELRGAKILAPRDVFPPTDDDEFYVCDVIGAQAVAPEGVLGVVENMISYPTCDALIVRRPRGDTIELPLVDGVVDEVDIAGHVVKLTPGDPLGLTADEAAAEKPAKPSRAERHQEKLARRAGRQAGEGGSEQGAASEGGSDRGAASEGGSDRGAASEGGDGPTGG